MLNINDANEFVFALVWVWKLKLHLQVFFEFTTENCKINTVFSLSSLMKSLYSFIFCQTIVKIIVMYFGNTSFRNILLLFYLKLIFYSMIPEDCVKWLQTATNGSKWFASYQYQSYFLHAILISFQIPIYSQGITKYERVSCRRSHFPVKSVWTIEVSVLCTWFRVVRSYLIGFPCIFAQFNA